MEAEEDISVTYPTSDCFMSRDWPAMRKSSWHSREAQGLIKRLDLLRNSGWVDTLVVIGYYRSIGWAIEAEGNWVSLLEIGDIRISDWLKGAGGPGFASFCEIQESSC